MATDGFSICSNFTHLPVLSALPLIQPLASSYQPLHCWFLHLFRLQPFCMEWPSPSCPTESSVWIPSDQTSRHFFFQNNRPTMFSAPCCSLPLLQVSVCYLFNLAMNYLLYSQHTLVCRCLCVYLCMYALTIVSPDKVLRCINTYCYWSLLS